MAQKKKDAKRASTRSAAVAAKSNIKCQVTEANDLDFGLSMGFLTASKHNTNCDKLSKLIEGKFTEWKIIYEPMRDNHGSVVLGGERHDGVPPLHVMHVNRNFNHPTKNPDMVRWVSIRPSSLLDSEGHPAGNGLFAERQFEKGETVGVHSGVRVHVPETMTLHTHPHCMHLHGTVVQMPRVASAVATPLAWQCTL
jgi:hypothetical protein